MEAEREAEAKQAELHRVKEEEQALEERARREAEEEVAALAEILELELEEMIVSGVGLVLREREYGERWVKYLTDLRYSLICAVYFACVLAIETW